MELGIVVALAYWGYHATDVGAARIVLAVVAPALAGGLAEGLRLLQELCISGLAAAGWFAAGQHVWGWALAGLSVLHHALVYALGDRLLKDGAQDIHGQSP